MEKLFEVTNSLNVDILYISDEEMKIEEAVALYFNISVDLLKSKRRAETIRLARQIAMFLYRKYTKLSSTCIGQKFNKDHATVLHATRMVQNMLETNYKHVKQDIEAIEMIMNY